MEPHETPPIHHRQLGRFGPSLPAGGGGFEWRPTRCRPERCGVPGVQQGPRVRPVLQPDRPGGVLHRLRPRGDQPRQREPRLQSGPMPHSMPPANSARADAHGAFVPWAGHFDAAVTDSPLGPATSGPHGASCPSHRYSSGGRYSLIHFNNATSWSGRLIIFSAVPIISPESNIST